MEFEYSIVVHLLSTVLYNETYLQESIQTTRLPIGALA